MYVSNVAIFSSQKKAKQNWFTCLPYCQLHLAISDQEDIIQFIEKFIKAY